jgi:phosphohistidine phosphatase
VLGERLAAEGVRPDAVLSSPLLRARETAQELARPAGLEAEPDERLAPGATAEGVKAAAADRGETVVVVGHQPDCSQIAAALTGGPEPAFAPCAMLTVEI